MTKKYIQEKIVSNIDKYNPRQLTCFHKPWAILFQSVNEDYFDLYLFVSVFYENFMYADYFYWEDFNKNLNENFYKFAKEILEPRFGVQIDKEIYRNPNGFILKIEKNLIEGNRVLIPADLIELPYYEDYKVDNHIHFYIIRGFDREKKIFYVLDNMHIDNGSDGIYKNFVLTYDRMYLIAQECFQSFFLNDDFPFFWQLRIKDTSDKYTPLKALINHKEELERIDCQTELIKFPEYKIINEGSKNINNFSRSYAKILNYKQVYYDMLFKLLRQINVAEHEIVGLESIKNDLCKKWETLRTYILYYSSKKEKMLLKLQEEYEKCESNEKKFRECFISLMNGREEKGAADIQKRCIENYSLFEQNINSAIIKRKKNNIIVSHSSDQIYDTWKVQDNAAQLNFRIDKNDEIEFKFDLILDNIIDFPFFGGLIIKNKRGERFLFGDDALCSIALYCPQWEQQFTLKKELYYQDAVSLRIKIEKEKVIFFYKEIEQTDWIKFHEIAIENIEEIGIISKTWNAIKHKSIFKNIEVLINKEKSEIYYL